MFKWFKRKPRNRRYDDREHLLDVKLRTRQARSAKLRLAAVWISLAAGVALAWHGGRLLLDFLIYKNDEFAIQHIEVRTDGALNSETIRQWAGVRPGQNLMALDLNRVQRDLEARPAIAFTAVERVLPHTLKLTVNERQPIAQTIVNYPRPDGSTEPFVVDFDEDGYAMQPLDPRWRTAPPPAGEHLPILTGVSAQEIQIGRPTESPQIRGALQLVAELCHSPMAGMADFKTIDVATPEILRVMTSQGTDVTFSLCRFDTQLRRWRVITDQYQHWGRAITSLDLSIANNLPVRSIAFTGPAPVPAPEPAKPARTKRKHV